MEKKVLYMYFLNDFFWLVTVFCVHLSIFASQEFLIRTAAGVLPDQKSLASKDAIYLMNFN